MTKERLRILYLSCHEILEFQEVQLFLELGHYCFSPGAYVEPRNRGDGNMRPDLPGVDAHMAQWQEDRAAYDAIQVTHRVSPEYADRKYHLTKEFVDRFDVVIVMHLPAFVEWNWDAIKHKPVVWRTIGQSISSTEAQMKEFRDQGMKIVRYSPKERTGIPGFIGEDAMIRFYVDDKEFGHWSGHVPEIITFNQDLPGRAEACNYELYKKVVAGMPHKLYGPRNEAHGPTAVGKVPYSELKLAMRHHRAYLYMGTHPASYTLNLMEAMVSGIPVIAPGPEHGNARYFPGHDLYEVPDIIEHGVNGFFSDNVEDLRCCLRAMLIDKDAARSVGHCGRERALELFGKQPIKEQWRAFLADL